MSATRRTRAQKEQAQIKHQSGLSYQLDAVDVKSDLPAPKLSKLVMTDPGLILQDLVKTGWVSGVILVLLLGLGMWLR